MKSEKKKPKSPLPFRTNTNYIRYLSGVVDTTKKRMRNISPEDAGRLWNAQLGMIGETSIEYFNASPYKGKYDQCRILLIHKDNLADILLYYWYNRKDEAYLNEIFDQTKTMFQFQK